MRTSTYLKTAAALTAGGSAFAGYLSSITAISGVCAFNEQCPDFLGHPACYTGFALFFAMFLGTLLALARDVRTEWPAVLNAALSTIGVFFAGSITTREMIRNQGAYQMGLPTCAYGLVFFIAVLVLSCLQLIGDRRALRLR